MSAPPITIVGGGLAGSEAALQLADAGHRVRLFEMRPTVKTPAHETPLLGELVCSNSLRSNDPAGAAGLLKEELRQLSCRLLDLAEEARVPAGQALAVDRLKFASVITKRIEEHPNIEVIREELTTLPDEPAILAPGPLASPALMEALEAFLGNRRLFFFDAIAPIVDADSLNMDRLFFATRYNNGEPDYLNAAMSRNEYVAFYQALFEGEKFTPHGFDAEDKLPLFESCQPIEAIAATGILSLAHGPMKPRGIEVPGERREAFAVVQLRAENADRTAYNLVGFQTRLTQSEQKRIFRMLPGLENARFLRYGALHRNSYIDGPRVLSDDLSLLERPGTFVAGQFAGGEGYTESIALGLLAARFLILRLKGKEIVNPPIETAIGALWRHVTQSPIEPLQPSHVHFGLFPPIMARGKEAKRKAHIARAREAFGPWLETLT